MGVVGQVLIALVVPIGWGLLSAYLFDRFRERRQKRCERPSARKGASK